jgi:hypothetical protein
MANGKGVQKSAEHRQKISTALRGLTKSAEHRRRMSEAQKGKPGRPMSEATKLKISVGNRGKVRTAEVRQRIRLALTGRTTPSGDARRNAERLMCPKCNTDKLAADFYVYNGRPMSWCKDCTRSCAKAISSAKSGTPAERERIWRRHGILGATWVDFVSKFEQQDGKCAICEIAISLKCDDVGVLAHLDHDHETGRIRGLLCRNCNRAVGLFGDDPVALERASAYLRRMP